jgi:hypothetical protein
MSTITGQSFGNTAKHAGHVRCVWLGEHGCFDGDGMVYAVLEVMGVDLAVISGI